MRERERDRVRERERQSEIEFEWELVWVWVREWVRVSVCVCVCECERVSAEMQVVQHVPHSWLRESECKDASCPAWATLLAQQTLNLGSFQHWDFCFVVDIYWPAVFSLWFLCQSSIAQAWVPALLGLQSTCRLWIRMEKHSGLDIHVCLYPSLWRKQA